MRKFLGALTILATCLGTTVFAEERVDVAIVLAIDTSGSMSDEEYAMQRDGYLQAFRDPRVHKSVSSGVNQKIALSIVHWSDQREQKVVIPWRILASESSFESLAADFAFVPRHYWGNTDISEALIFSANYLTRLPLVAQRKVIDISGDGRSSTDRATDTTNNAIIIELESVRDTVTAQGITINGLPILGSEAYLDEYYRDFVIGGSEAFFVPATNDASFAEALVKKLVREIETPIAMLE